MLQTIQCLIYHAYYFPIQVTVTHMAVQKDTTLRYKYVLGRCAMLPSRIKTKHFALIKCI